MSIKLGNKQLVFITSFLLIASIVFPLNFHRIDNELENESISNLNCSIFTVKGNDKVYFGNNEDEGGNRRRTDIWFVPSVDDQTYGCVYFGFVENEPGGDDVDGIEIGGMNSEGLCYDGNGIFPYEYVVPRDDLGVGYDNLYHLDRILRECANVVEVIEWYQTHNFGGWWGDQIHWADKSGDAVVVSPGLYGGIAFTRISGDFLISTNFNVDHPGGLYYPCPRYTEMTYLLGNMTATNNVTLEKCAQVLEAVHVSKYLSYPGTLYSNVFDLKEQMIHLYIWGNYDDLITLNLTEELEKGYHGYRINDLAAYSPEELFSDYNLWPIEPKFGNFSISVVVVILTLPIVGLTGYWIFIRRQFKNKDQGGKADGA
jgi:hypothetical protein